MQPPVTADPAVRIERRRSSSRAVPISVVVGALTGYLVLSPFAMAFFHLTHGRVQPDLLGRMASPIGAVRVSLSLGLWLWWLPFVALGGVLGAAVGLVLLRMRRDQRRIADHAAGLAETNGRLEKAYDQLVHADRLASVGLIAATVIHDVNGYLSFLLITAEAEEAADRGRGGDGSAWARVRQYTDRMRLLCEAARRVARRSPANHDAIDVHDVVEETLQLTRTAAQGGGIRRLVRLEATSTRIDGPAGDLVQVLLNLIRNALDAVQSGGLLTVQTRDHRGGVEIRVTDDGEGIPPEVLPRIFDAFFTTKSEGTGLGLAICRRLVELHGGQIDADSAQGAGTTFRVWLPAAASQRRAHDRAA